MVSIIGSKVRIVQTHIISEEQRIKVRYSHFFDFRYCPAQQTLDLCLRWLLSGPLLGDSPLPDEERGSELPPAPASEVALSLEHAFRSPLTTRTGRLMGEAPMSDFATSPRRMVMAVLKR